MTSSNNSSKTSISSESPSFSNEELAHANKTQLAYESFLVRLLRAQWHHRQETALTWRIKRARLPEQWTLESFPFKKQPGVSRRQFRSLAELDFIAKAENIVLIGPTGVGKTGLGHRFAHESAPERTPLSVRPRSGPLRRHVRLARRPLQPKTYSTSSSASTS